jgi:hypothetical protein
MNSIETKIFQKVSFIGYKNQVVYKLINTKFDMFQNHVT